MTETPDVTPTPTPSNTVPINDVDHFAFLISDWYRNLLAKMNHLLTVPEGSVFQVGEKEVVLGSEAFAGFQLGVELAIMQAGNLPFVVEELEQAPADPAAATPATDADPVPE